MLNETQRRFIDTINHGPERLDPALFAGPLDRVLLGLQAHANTINHARIVALEETYPLTRRHLGETAFHRQAQIFVETDAARACDLNRIGHYFPEHLTDSQTRELAHIEWAWLECYHAAEASPLALEQLAALGQTALLAFSVAVHPASRLVITNHPLALELDDIAGQKPASLLLVRPDAEVQLIPLDAVETHLYQAARQNNATIGNLLSAAIEQVAEADPLRPVMTLIGAGALVAGG